LALSLAIMLCHGSALPTAAGCNWWGVMFPELAAPSAAVRTWSGPDSSGGTEVRCWLFEQIAALKSA